VAWAEVACSKFFPIGPHLPALLRALSKGFSTRLGSLHSCQLALIVLLALQKRFPMLYNKACTKLVE